MVREKLDQAVQILREKDLDLWITFVRETTQVKDPSLDLILGLNLTWQSALMVSRTGERIAIVGRYDVDNVRIVGGYTTVIGYDQSIREPLLEQIERLRPRRIGLNFSESDPAADGLTHGMFRVIAGILAGTEYSLRIVSAEEVIAALRGRKTPAEVDRIRAAIGAAEGILREVEALVQPRMTEREIAQFIHQTVRERGLEVAWEPDYCPIVCAGPESSFGHRMPGDYRVERGQLLQIDFGVRWEGFVSDLQRTLYFCRPGEESPPEEVLRAWHAARAALEAGRGALRPGARGWEVDAAARRTLTEAGYPEYMHAFGHHIGRSVHDGATVLGPRWERYGTTVEGVVEAGNVFAIELGVYVPGYGYIGCEEDVLVTESGAEYLSEPQEEIWCVRK
ncbi:MAG: aminopeptidase P family protein [Thermoflexia bacterium]|nr:MAG: aminopeptidase P family protein [Thermoflexia bacterium]